jgi:hypothetical protein
MQDVLDYIGNGKEGPRIPVRSGAGLGNTNPIATQGLAYSSTALRTPPRKKNPRILEAKDLIVGLPSPGTPTLVQIETLSADPNPVVATLSGEGGMSADAEILSGARALKPAGQVILFQKIMQDWDFTDQEAATLLGFEAAADIREIYLGTKPVAHRDANDRLGAVLRIATDLDDLFREVAAIQDWLSEPQRDLDGAKPRSLLTEGSMENLLRIKYYVAYLSGR